MTPPSSLHLAAADAVLIAHALFVVFVVGGLAAIYVGRLLRWSWVRNRAFRIVHLAAIAIVVAQAWLGVICPLTRFEMALREAAGDATYSGAFVAHWVERLLYFDAPWWVFVAGYSVFGIAVAASWFIVPPHRARRHGRARKF